MSNLSYRTRGNSSPQGRERVYFTCHPADFKAFFEPICEDILKTQNCAIWYRADLEEENPEKKMNEEELALDLSQMQLFVIPITSRFLSLPNRALDVDFKYAIEHHIPVLPLMQEEGLENEFNRICGDLQFLDRQASEKDLTALSYEEKLKRFLESVLLGDDLAAKVRAAFDAYIFLSYRKKDRKYAQELMRLIHKNPFCRDIAIWYDEFLTPGENFNDAIRDAMEKSSLFAMVVTPNLVNEENYVMTTEYPKAAEAGMPVLPAQMVETDVDALSSSYPGICDDDVTDARDDRALSEALAAMLQGTMTEEQLKRIRRTAMADEAADDDPQHLFFIGLAYLGGIDVEVDTARAVEMITRAADAGLEEAMEKLANMYYSGNGLQKDYDASMRWQERLVDKTRDNFEQNRTEERGQKYFEALWDLGDYIWEMRKIGRSKEIYSEALRLSLEMTEQFYSARSRRNLASTYDELGGICKEEKDFERAREYYEEGLHIREKLAEETETVECCRDLSSSYSSLGGICWAEGDLGRAREYYEKSLSIREKMREDTGTHESGHDLCYSYFNLGGICMEEGDLSRAREYYEAAMQLSEKLIKEADIVRNYRVRSISYEYLGDISAAEGEWSRAREYYEKGFQIAVDIEEQVRTVAYRSELGDFYDRLGSVCEKEGEIGRARDYYEAGLRLSEQISKETGTRMSRRCITIFCDRLGDVSAAEGEWSKAREYYERSLQLREELEKEIGTRESRHDLSVSYDRLGDVCKAEGDLGKAREYYEKRLQLSEKLAKETETRESRRSLALSYYSLGRVLQAEGNLSKAKYYYEEELRISAELAKEAGTVESRHDLSVSYDKLGGICKEEGDIGKAKEFYERALQIREELVKEVKIATYYDDLACSYYQLGTLEESDDNRRMLGMTLLIWEHLASMYPEVKRYTELAEAMRQVMAEYE